MELLSELISIVAPPRCPVCRGAADDARAGLCAGCRAQLPWRSAGACRRCGLDEHRHARCPGRGGAVARAWAPMAYEGVARRLVHELKFHGRLALVDVMAAQLAANLPGDLRRAGAVVVPVPPHGGRRRRRGHDPVDVLAAGLARRARLPIERCLKRSDSASRQLGATRVQRTTAGRLTVAVTRAPVAPRILLVDDVHTTGATLEQCARALRGAGARWVAGVTYARAL